MLKNLIKSWKLLFTASLLGIMTLNISHAQRAWVYIQELIEEPVWNYETSDLEVDPRIQFGELENGLRYAILPNEEPPGRVSMRLLIRSGSLMEAEDQRGLAHFLEHMAFNGTRSFSEGDLIEYFQRLGMGFGAHTNAHTSLDETVYKLELPNNEKETLNTGLQVFRDFADGMLLKASSIDAERGVVYSELRDGLSPEWNILQEELKFYFDGTLIPNRLPIGLETVILTAPKERLDAFYRDWYTADRMTLVIVGNVQPDEVESLIKSHFKDMASAKKKPEPELGKVNFQESRAKVHAELNAPSTDITVVVIKNVDPIQDSKKERMKSLKINLGYNILNQRLDILRHKPDAPCYGSAASSMTWFDRFEIHAVGLTCKAENWKQALLTAEQEVRRIVEYGFTDAEFQEAKLRFINIHEQAVRNASTIKSQAHSDALTSAISQDKVYTTPEYDLVLLQETLENFTKEEAHQLFTENWTHDPVQIFISGNEELKATNEEALKAYQESKSIEVEAPKNEVVPEFAYQTFGEPSKVVFESTDPELGLYQYRFENNVHLNILPTDYQKGDIAVNVNFGKGANDTDPAMLGLDLIADKTFTNGGLEAHSITEISRIYSDAVVSIDFNLDRGTFSLSGHTTPKDLRKQLNLITAFMIAPGFREESLVLARKYFEDFYKQQDTTPQGIYANQVDRYLAKDNPLFGVPEKEEVMRFHLEDVKNWLKNPLKTGVMEVTIVGDVAIKDALDAVANTLGALPLREAQKDLNLLEGIEFPTSHEMKTFYVNSTIPKALASVVWATNDYWDIIRARKLSLLGEIYSDRLRKEIREKLGDAYSPYAYHNPSRHFKNYGRFIAMAGVSPEQTEKVVNIMTAIGQDLANGNISQDEIERAQKPLLEQLKQMERQNGYWISQLSQIQAFPQTLDWAKKRRQHYESFTLDEIKALAKEYLNADKAYRLLIMPKNNDSSSENPSEQSQ